MIDIKIGNAFGDIKITGFYRGPVKNKPMQTRKMINYQCSCGRKYSTSVGNLNKKIQKKLFSCKNCMKRKAAIKRGRTVCFKETMNLYKRSAFYRGFEFAITIDEIKKLFKGNCHYCGKPPSNIRTKREFNTPFIYSGIDRVNNKIGYTKDNTVSSCKECNWLKHTKSKDDFLSLIEKIYKHSFGVKND